jgi:hypothetical protein
MTPVNARSGQPHYYIISMIEDDTVQLKPTDTITVLASFDAVRLFLEVVWQRRGKDAAEVTFVLGARRWEDGTPTDPATWKDWLIAVQSPDRTAEERWIDDAQFL